MKELEEQLARGLEGLKHKAIELAKHYPEEIVKRELAGVGAKQFQSAVEKFRRTETELTDEEIEEIIDNFTKSYGDLFESKIGTELKDIRSVK